MSSANYGPGAAQWAARLSRWTRRRHLHGLVTAALDLAEPLGPLGAQLLWIAQPALGVVMPRGEIDSLARLIDSPGGMAWLRDQLENDSLDATQQPNDDTGADNT